MIGKSNKMRMGVSKQELPKARCCYGDDNQMRPMRKSKRMDRVEIDPENDNERRRGEDSVRIQTL